MKKSKKLLLKIIAGSLAIGLIGSILFITNSFVGNPISATLADKAIKQYVEKNYSFLDLELEKASYNFKDETYTAKAESKTSIDTKFYIYYRDGKVLWDDYEADVLGKSNTLQRLSDEYSVMAKNIVAKELGLENNTTRVRYDYDEYENVDDLLELDMKFDKALPIKAEVTIGLDLSDRSLEGIAKVLTDAHRAFINNDCNFNKYHLEAETGGMLIIVNGVTPSHIESGELVSLLEEAKNSDNVGGISVFIKE